MTKNEKIAIGVMTFLLAIIVLQQVCLHQAWSNERWLGNKIENQYLSTQPKGPR